MVMAMTFVQRSLPRWELNISAGISSVSQDFRFGNMCFFSFLLFHFFEDITTLILIK